MDAEQVEQRLHELRDKLDGADEVPDHVYAILCDLIGILRLMNRGAS